MWPFLTVVCLCVWFCYFVPGWWQSRKRLWKDQNQGYFALTESRAAGLFLMFIHFVTRALLAHANSYNWPRGYSAGGRLLPMDHSTLCFPALKPASSFCFRHSSPWVVSTDIWSQEPPATAEWEPPRRYIAPLSLNTSPLRYRWPHFPQLFS